MSILLDISTRSIDVNVDFAISIHIIHYIIIQFIRIIQSSRIVLPIYEIRNIIDFHTKN